MLFEKFVNTLAGNSGAEISEKGNGAGAPRRFPQFLGMRGGRNARVRRRKSAKNNAPLNGAHLGGLLRGRERRPAEPAARSCAYAAVTMKMCKGQLHVGRRGVLPVRPLIL